MTKANNQHSKSATRGTKSVGSAQLGSMKRASRVSEYEMRVIDQSRIMNFEPDSFSAAWLADCKPDWVSPELFFEVTDALRGFDSDMALIIADDIIDVWHGLGLHYTGYEHIDAILSRLYAKILACAFKKGIKLEYHFK